AGKPSEWYVTYPDGTFAFSNSEGLVQSVIDRKNRGESRNPSVGSGTREISGATSERSLTDVARFQSAKRRLPGQAVARLFVEPRQIERMIAASPPPSKASDARILSMLERYLGAVEYAGAALVWNNSGIVVHTVETLAPSKLDAWLLHWAGNDLGR